jgi:phosphatidylglycerol:prolipoprotein diacylglycerol transferase
VPHSFLGIPVLGFGWALVLLAFGVVGYVATSRKKQPLSKILEEQGVMWAVAACIIAFVLPQIETRIDDGTPQGFNVGLPVRGYGVMLMLGVLSALGIALYRCKRVGIGQEAFFSLATWVVLSGLLGARIFYVVQKWDELAGDSIAGKIWTAVKVTEGGLVVYGSVIGGLIAMLVWCRRNRMPIVPIADSITPAFFIGLAFGRLGCLLNGCCYGGVCDLPLPSIAFPAGSPAYMDQFATGKLLGIGADKAPSSAEPQNIESVASDSWAAANKIQIGQRLVSIREMMVAGPTPNEPMLNPVFQAEVKIDGRRFQVPADEVPTRSVPVHPSQVYAAISGLMLCGWTLLLSETTRRNGVVFGSGLVAYGVLRIIEEIIRVDEAGQFGTSLSIAQWISLAGIAFGFAMIAQAFLRKRGEEQVAHSGG